MKGIECPPVRGYIPVKPASGQTLVKRRRESPAKLAKRGWGLRKGCAMLQRVLVVYKPEQPIFDNRSADAETHLTTIERRINSVDPGSHGIIPEEVERTPMNVIASGAGNHVHRSRSRDAVCRIESGLCDLEFLNGLFRKVDGSSTDSIISNVNAVHLNAGGPSRPALQRDAGKTLLGGIEISTILHLHAGVQLCQIEEITSIEWNFIDLLSCQYVFHYRLSSVHRCSILRDQNFGLLRSQRHDEVSIGGHPDGNGNIETTFAKTGSVEGQRIISWHQCNSGVHT